jgi:hypothetical protein
LSRYHEEGDVFLCSTIISDEMQLHHYEPGSKHQNMKWKTPDGPY